MRHTEATVTPELLVQGPFELLVCIVSWNLFSKLGYMPRDRTQGTVPKGPYPRDRTQGTVPESSRKQESGYDSPELQWGPILPL